MFQSVTTPALLFDLAGFVQRASSESAFSFSRTPKAGWQGWCNCRAKGRGIYWVKGAAKTIWEKEDWIWDKNEVNGGGLAKADGIFASKFSVHTSV